jgi:hypothetical protein
MSVDPKDPTTWTIAEDKLPDGRRVSTTWSPFATVGLFDDTELHYQTDIVEANGTLGAAWEYESEREAKLGHQRVVDDLRRQWEAR